MVDRWRDNSRDVFFHRPVRVNLSGDKEAAKEYIHETKRMLFQLKNRQQTGDPVQLHRRKVEVNFGNGKTDYIWFQVQTTPFGMDIVDIYHPFAPVVEGTYQPQQEEVVDFPVPIILAFATANDPGDSAVGGYFAENFIASFIHYIEDTDNVLPDTTFDDGKFSQCDAVGTPSLVQHRLYQSSDTTNVLVSYQAYSPPDQNPTWVTESHTVQPIRIQGYFTKELGNSINDFYFTKYDDFLGDGKAHYTDYVQENNRYAHCYHGYQTWDGGTAFDSWSSVWEDEGKYCYQYDFYYDSFLDETKTGTNDYEYSYYGGDARLYSLDIAFPQRRRTDDFVFATDTDDFVVQHHENVNGIDVSDCAEYWGLGTGVFDYNGEPVYMCSYIFSFPSCDSSEYSDFYMEYCFVYQSTIHRLRFQCSGDYYDDPYEPWHYFSNAVYTDQDGNETPFNDFPTELSGLIGNGRFRVGSKTST